MSNSSSSAAADLPPLTSITSSSSSASSSAPSFATSSSSPLFSLPTLSSAFASSVSSSLSAAAASDASYTSINNAKLRSVEQHHSYEQFTQMVAGAHLKPVNLSQQPLNEIVKTHHQLGKRELFEDGRATALDPFASPFTTAAASSNLASSSSSSPAVVSLLAPAAASSSTSRFPRPTSSHEFIRDWNRLGLLPDRDTEHLLYLKQLPPSSFRNVMRAGAGLESLGEIVEVINRALTKDAAKVSGAEGEANAQEELRQKKEADVPSSQTSSSSAATIAPGEAFGLLAGLSAVDRFSMNVGFLSKQEKQQAKELFERLEAVAPTEAPTSSQQASSTSSAEPSNESATASKSSPSDSAALSSLIAQTAKLSLVGASNGTAPPSSKASSSAYPMMLPGWGKPVGSTSSNAAKGAATAGASGKPSSATSKPANGASGRADYVAPAFTVANVHRIRDLYLS